MTRHIPLTELEQRILEGHSAIEFKMRLMGCDELAFELAQQTQLCLSAVRLARREVEQVRRKRWRDRVLRGRKRLETIKLTSDVFKY